MTPEEFSESIAKLKVQISKLPLYLRSSLYYPVAPDSDMGRRLEKVDHLHDWTFDRVREVCDCGMHHLDYKVGRHSRGRYTKICEARDTAEKIRKRTNEIHTLRDYPR